MLEILEFITKDFRHFIVVLIILGGLCQFILELVTAINTKTIKNCQDCELRKDT